MQVCTDNLFGVWRDVIDDILDRWSASRSDGGQLTGHEDRRMIFTPPTESFEST